MGTLIPPQKKKKEEPGSKFKYNYSGHGKTVSQVFDDKNLVSAEAKWVGRRREKVAEELGGPRPDLHRAHEDHGSKGAV